MINKRIMRFGVLFVLVFLLIGLNAISAADSNDDSLNLTDSMDSTVVDTVIDDVNAESESSENSNLLDESSNADMQSNVIDESDLEADSSELTDDNSKSTLGAGEKTIHTITEANYSEYFDSNGNLINSLVKANDTINLSGNFSNKKFMINIPLTITSLESNAFLKNSPIYIQGVNNENFLYDATVSNLKIESDLANISAVWVIGSSCIKVLQNDIFTTGHNGYPISLDSFTYNCIVDGNIIKTVVPVNVAISSSSAESEEEANKSGDNSSWQHSGISLRDAHWNSIVNNDITVENSYGIYLCFGVSISNNNLIANNTIRATSETPSFWSYGVYLTGNNNTVADNTIIRMYRGIHSSYPHNIIVGNKIYDINGFDENNGIGGDYAIYGGNDTLIANNSIYNADVIGAGILVGSNSDVYGNYIQINSSGEGIRIGDVEGGHNSKVYNNIIDFLDGAGITLKGEPRDTEVYNNIINSLSNIGANQGTGLGVGILSIYQSRSKRPYNIAIYNNTIYTSNNCAINIAQSSTESYLCINNIIGDAIIIYPISSGVVPEFIDGNVYEITDEDYSTYFDSNGCLKDIVQNGDTLIFAGNFSPKGKIVLNKTVCLIGDGAVLKDTTIFINTSNCRVQDFTILNNGTSDDKCNLWGVYVYEADNAVISGNNISIWDKNTSYGIYLCDSTNDTVVNNSIICQGDNLVFAVLTYETYDTLFENNSILAIGTSELYPYYETICIDGVRSISELSKTYGVILDFSSDNQFIHNDIEVTSTVEGFQVPYNPSVNILIGLYIYYDSNRNNISENNVYIHGHDPFLYGLGSSGDDTSKSVTYACENVFSNNNITIDADYFAMGMILRHNSKDTVVESNNFNLYSNNYTYGLTLEISEGSQIINNNLNLTGRAGIYAMELYASNWNNITRNNIVANGSYSSVDLYASSDNQITYNNVLTVGSGEYEPAQGTEHPDSVDLFTAGFSFQKGSNRNNLSNNNISTNGDYAAHFDEYSTGNNVEGNNLSSSVEGKQPGVYDPNGKNTVKINSWKKYSEGGSSSSSNSNSSSSSENKLPIHNNGNSGQSQNSNSQGSSSYNGDADSSGSSSLGQVDLGLTANAMSSLSDGTGEVGGSESGDVSDLLAKEISEVASKTLSGMYVPIVALILVLVFCFSFLNSKDEDDGEE